MIICSFFSGPPFSFGQTIAVKILQPAYTLLPLCCKLHFDHLDGLYLIQFGLFFPV